MCPERRHWWPALAALGLLLALVAAGDLYLAGQATTTAEQLRVVAATATASAAQQAGARGTATRAGQEAAAVAGAMTASAGQAATAVAGVAPAARALRALRAATLADQARRLLGRDPELAILLAMAAISTTIAAGDPPLPQAESVLHAAIQRPWPRLILATAAPGRLADVRYSPSGVRLLAVMARGPVEVWTVETGVAWRTLRPAGGARTAAWSPDERSIATLDAAGGLQIWDLESGRPRLTVAPSGPGRPPPAAWLAWSPDGGRIALPGDPAGAPVVRDAADGHVLLALRGHTGAASALAWSPDGRRLATGSGDGTLRLWDAGAAAGRGAAGAVVAIPAGMVALAWRPDGARLATVAADGRVQLWDVADSAAAPRAV
ncbi:MAG TPA: hypothetical protein VKY74_15230, partial [Chloroflexia bacterium]|nr:hypothetical protein [Chloroflexia bacterium]